MPRLACSASLVYLNSLVPCVSTFFSSVSSFIVKVLHSHRALSASISCLVFPLGVSPVSTQFSMHI